MVAEDANRQVFHGRNLDWNLPPEVSMPLADVSLLCRPCLGPGRDEQASANAVLSFFMSPQRPFLADAAIHPGHRVPEGGRDAVHWNHAGLSLLHANKTTRVGPSPQSRLLKTNSLVGARLLRSFRFPVESKSNFRTPKL